MLIGGLLLSLAGVTLRHMESASGWQILFYRALAFSVAILLFLVLRYRLRVFRAFVQVGSPGLIIGLALGLGSVCYLFSLLLTTVANALFVVSSGPFITAVLGWIVLRERVRPVTWITMTFALTGVAIMVFNGIQSGRLLGNLVALGAAVTFAIMLVTLRRSGIATCSPPSVWPGWSGWRSGSPCPTPLSSPVTI